MKFRSNTQKVVLTIVADVVVFAIALLTFAWFHHARPIDNNPIEMLATPTPNALPTPGITPENSPSASPDSTSDITEGPTQEPTEEPTPEPTGLLKGKYADKFTDGEIIVTDDYYRSENVCIEMDTVSTRIQGYNVTYYIADIYIQDITSFRTENAQTDNNKERLEAMAERTDAIVAVSGDYWMFKKQGLVIRNGQLYRDELQEGQDVCVLYYDGTMETYLADEVDYDAILAKYPLHAWSFGPKLLENGEPMTEFNCNDYIANWHPRCAIGYYEPGHYCFVLIDGRQPGYSDGLSIVELSKLMAKLGCTEAYNLDGGMTAMMWYDDSLRSKPCENGRQNCDMLYIGEPLA